MIPGINRYESYTRAFCSSLQTSGKVLKRCNNQMIRYWIFTKNQVDHICATYGFLKHFDTKIIYIIIYIYQKPKSLVVWVGETWLLFYFQKLRNG